ncbi:MAG: cation:proton antiporter [Thermoprotei archaeon]
MLPGVNQTDQSLLEIGLLLICVKVIEDLFQRARLPSIVGAIIAGIILGGSVLHVVSSTPAISVMIQLGVIMMLFLAGADEFDLSSGDIGRKRSRFLAGILVSWIGPTFVMITVLRFYMNLGLASSLYTGVVLGMSSVAPLARVYMDLNLSKTLTAVNSFTFTLYIEVIGIIAAAVSLEYASSSSASLVLSSATVAGIVALILALYFSRPFLVRFAKFIERAMKSREASFSLIVAAVLVAGYLGAVARFNDAMVALFLGVAFSRYISERPNLLERLHAFTYGFFEPLFFGGLGLFVDLKVFSSDWKILLLIVCLTFGSKMAFGYVGGLLRSARYPSINAVASSFKGGVDGALLLTGLTVGVISGFLYSAALVAIMLQITVGSILLKGLKSKVSDQIRSDTEVTLPHSYVKWLAQGVPAITIAKMLPDLVLDQEMRVEDALQKLSANIPAGVVIDAQGKPVGCVTLNDLAQVPKTKQRLKALREVMLRDVAAVDENTPAWELLDMFSETGVPIVAIVDSAGKVVGTASEKEFLLYLTGTK